MEMGTIIAWHKAEGEQVAVGDALYEVENEKSVIAVQAMAPGLLVKIIAPASAEVRVGEAVAVMAEVGSMPTPSEIAELLAGESVGRCAVGRVTRARPGAGAETGEKASTRKTAHPRHAQGSGAGQEPRGGPGFGAGDRSGGDHHPR